MERREAFKRWLQNEKHKKSDKHIPEKAVNNYIKGIHKISDIMYESGVISKRLYSMKDIEEIQAAVDQIKKDCTYLSLNIKSENMYDKALTHYVSFSQVEQD